MLSSHTICRVYIPGVCFLCMCVSSCQVRYVMQQCVCERAAINSCGYTTFTDSLEFDTGTPSLFPVQALVIHTYKTHTHKHSLHTNTMRNKSLTVYMWSSVFIVFVKYPRLHFPPVLDINVSTNVTIVSQHLKYDSCVCVEGVGCGLVYAATLTITCQYFEKRRGLALGIVTTGIAFRIFPSTHHIKVGFRRF